MKEEICSTYEAKARLSELLAKVRRNNKRIVITHRGKPVAELGPISRSEETLAERMARLEAEGIIVSRDTDSLDSLGSISTRKGALKRFLEDRN